MLVKKIIFIVILLIIAIAVLFNLEIKPETKEVVKEVKPSVNVAPANVNLPSQ
jgi:hypothetical protein